MAVTVYSVSGWVRVRGDHQHTVHTLAWIGLNQGGGMVGVIQSKDDVAHHLTAGGELHSDSGRKGAGGKKSGIVFCLKRPGLTVGRKGPGGFGAFGFRIGHGFGDGVFLLLQNEGGGLIRERGRGGGSGIE